MREKARRGDANAERELTGPECPEEIRYLVDWSDELRGRSGVGMDGPAPLSFPAIESWARVLRIRPEPHEIRALLMLDDVMRNPTEPKDEDTAETTRNVETPKWPERKPGVVPLFRTEDD